MASLFIIDAAGTGLSYELPEDDGAVWTLGSDAAATITLEGGDIAPQHASLSSLQSTPTITAVGGAVVVNGEPITEPTLLVEGVAYGIGSYTLHYGSMPEGTEDEGSEEPAAEGHPRRRVVRRRAAVAPVGKKENILVTLITPFYVIGILGAAFLAGLTLRYWMMTGGYLPSELLK